MKNFSSVVPCTVCQSDCRMFCTVAGLLVPASLLILPKNSSIFLVFPLLLHTNTASSAVFLGPPAYSLSTTATLSIQPSPSTSHNLFICHSVLTYVKEICKKSVKAYVEEICKSRHLSSRICRWWKTTRNCVQIWTNWVGLLLKPRLMAVKLTDTSPQLAKTVRNFRI